MTGASFDSIKTPLENLLEEADGGKLQLPDFQRGWIWDNERIRSLLASVSVSFPIGAVMLLQTGGQHIRFRPRPLEGTNFPSCDPDTLILDGQQRLTSLYRALMSQAAVETKNTKGKKIDRWYYIDMKRAILPEIDREDTVISVPQDRLVKTFRGIITLDVTTPDREYAADLFPANQIFSSKKWRREYNKYWNHEPDKARLFDDFDSEVIERFERYDVPVIKLGKDTPKEAVCLVFERVNTSGVDLTVFELLTASFAADDFQLRDDWDTREKRLKNQHLVLLNLKSDDFLQAISLLVTQSRRRDVINNDTPTDKAPGISCKRKEILNLKVDDWKTWADRVEDGFKRAARFLHGQKIFKARDLPYRTQLVPLAAIFTDLGSDAEPEGARLKIARWYWCGVLGELYGGTLESRFARDLPEVVAWVGGQASEADTIFESNFQAERLKTLRTRNSAAYKGLYALLMRDGGCDFRTGDPMEEHVFFDDKIDIHHIFPEKWCKKNGIDRAVYNSIINKTAISARTNRQIGGLAPSKYLPKIERKARIKPERMDKILASHRIATQHLRTDQFWEFYGARAESLLKSIERATGKGITREPRIFDP